MPTRSIPITLSLTSLALVLAAGCGSSTAFDAEGSSGEVEGSTGAMDEETAETPVMTTTEAPTSAGIDGLVDVECSPGSTEACAYDGPAGTLQVGSCRAAVRECDDAGRWGVCRGEVRPRVEDCRTVADEDCDGVAACSGAVEWVRSFGQPQGGGDGSYATAEALAIDRHERVWFTGSFTGALQIDGEGWALPGQQTMYLARLGADGTPQLALADTREAACGYGSRLAIGSSGELAVGAANCGSLQLAASAPVHVNQGGWHSSLAGVFSGAGDFLRDLAMSSNGEGYFDISGLKFDGAGNLWVAGRFFGPAATLGEGYDAQMIDGGGAADGIVVKLGPDGAIAWAHGFGDADGQEIAAIDVDDAGNVWLAGGFRGSMQFAGGSLTSDKGGTNDWSSFVVKLDGDGAWQWGRAYSTAKTQMISQLRVDDEGEVVLAGYYVGPSMVLGDEHLANKVSNSAMLVARLDGHGNPVWVDSWPCVGACYPDSMALDGAGQGVFSTLLEPDSAVVIDGQVTWAPSDSETGVIAKLDRDGALVWAPRAYRADAKLAVGPTGAIYMTGSHAGAISFGDAPALQLDAGADGENVYVARARP